MNIFKNKFLIKLIATLCLFLALISFGAPTTVHADPGDDDDGWGGVLITPVVKLLTALGDGVMELLHSSVQDQGVTLIKLDGSFSWQKIFSGIFAVAIAIFVAAIVIASVVATGGVITSILGAIGLSTATAGATITLGVVAFGSVSGILVGKYLYEGWVPDDIYLPLFSISAEEIFSNEIAFFDINFFSNDRDRYGTRAEVSESEFYNQTYSNSNSSQYEPLIQNGDGYTPKSLYDAQNSDRKKKLLRDCFAEIRRRYNDETGLTTNQTDNYEIEVSSSVNNNIANLSGSVIYTNRITVKRNEGNTYIITYEKKDTPISVSNGTYTCEESVRIGMRQIVNEPIISTAQQLKGVVSKWYFILCNLALLVLMVVLIYIGIRITLASTSGDKAKYKERIIDWIVAICLLFVMHYIMIFAVEIVDRITDLVKAETGEKGNFMVIPLTNNQLNSAKEFFKNDENGRSLETAKVAELDEVNKLLSWRTDLVGAFRIQSQLTNEGTGKWVGYSFSYFVLVLFTIFFSWAYLKRIVYMAFLTMIAPLVAMTYPIDKITDGKAQAFNAWLKEYIFNLLIQPMHLLLYTVLVSSAFELASESAIYALVSLGFMMPAEKLIRKFFGFEKASTPSMLGGAAGAALAMTGINKMLGHRPKGGSSGGKNSGGNESKDSIKMNLHNNEGINRVKGITGEAPKNGEIQDRKESNIRADGSGTVKRGNAKLKQSNADHSELAEDIFKNMHGPDPNMSRDADHSELAEDIFENMHGPDPNMSRDADHSELAEDIFENMHGPEPNVSMDDADHSELAEDIFENMHGPEPNVSMDDADHSELAEDIFENMHGPDPNVSMDDEDYSELAEDIFENMHGPEPNVSSVDAGQSVQNENRLESKQRPKPNVSRRDKQHSLPPEKIVVDMSGAHPNNSVQNEKPILRRSTKKELQEQEENNFFNQFDEERFRKGTKASTGAYYRALGKSIGNKIQNGHPIRALARGAAGLAGAATFGAAGLALGVVSGDPSKAFQYASAGALGGNKLASSTVGAVQRATSVDEDYLKEQYELAAYEGEYKKHKLEQEKKKMQESEKYIDYLQKTMSISREKAKEVLKDTGRKCFDSGITNIEDIATIHKMTEGKDGIKIEEAIAAKKWNNLLPSDVHKMEVDKREKYIKTWMEDYKKAGWSEKESEFFAKKSMDYAIKFANEKSSLYKAEV